MINPQREALINSYRLTSDKDKLVEDIIGHFRSMICGIMYKRFGNEVDTDDFIQNVTIKVINSIDKLDFSRDNDDVSSFMYGMIMFSVRDVVRSFKRSLRRRSHIILDCDYGVVNNDESDVVPSVIDTSPDTSNYANGVFNVENVEHIEKVLGVLEVLVQECSTKQDTRKMFLEWFLVNGYWPDSFDIRYIVTPTRMSQIRREIANEVIRRLGEGTTPKK